MCVCLLFIWDGNVECIPSPDPGMKHGMDSIIRFWNGIWNVFHHQILGWIMEYIPSYDSGMEYRIAFHHPILEWNMECVPPSDPGMEHGMHSIRRTWKGCWISWHLRRNNYPSLNIWSPSRPWNSRHGSVHSRRFPGLSRAGYFRGGGGIVLAAAAGDTEGRRQRTAVQERRSEAMMETSAAGSSYRLGSWPAVGGAYVEKGPWVRHRRDPRSCPGVDRSTGEEGEVCIAFDNKLLDSFPPFRGPCIGRRLRRSVSVHAASGPSGNIGPRK